MLISGDLQLVQQIRIVDELAQLGIGNVVFDREFLELLCQTLGAFDGLDRDNLLGDLVGLPDVGDQVVRGLDRRRARVGDIVQGGVDLSDVLQPHQTGDDAEHGNRRKARDQARRDLDVLQPTQHSAV